MEPIKIESGEQQIPIERDGVSTGEITINPGDTLFMERFYKAFGDITNKLESHRTDEAPDIEKQFELIKGINAFMRERIDYAFGAGASQIAFGDVVSYDFGIYIQFIDQINKIIEPARASALNKYIPTSQKPPRRTRKPRKR
ncbi:MAG: hypothetical protein EHM33_00935 [Chloroflexi bacterium]|nr:MAG: hypothetical protein EHM33_00935 [Chloroflexota bacterium]